MSLEENKALVRALFERVVNDQDLQLAGQIVAAEYVDRSALPTSVASGPESLRDFVARQRAAYPDAHVVVEDMMAEEDRVAARISMTGTSARSGRRVRYHGSVWWRVADGKVVERWGAAFAREEG
jgi:predicted ester cyclase